MRIDTLMENLPARYSQADRELILRAYRLAERSHESQRRSSGEPYVSHCVAVASILAEMCVPPTVVAAGLLHDTVEDTDVTLANLRDDFGPEVMKLVDGVTKLTQLPRISRGGEHPGEEDIKETEARELAERRGQALPEEEVEALLRSRKRALVLETLRKTFLAMGDDVRVVMIKLADRLHNMRTLSYLPEYKRKRIAEETLEIFAPLANRLGIWQVKWELEDLAFRYVYPEKYREIAEKLAGRRTEREREMQEVAARLHTLLGQAGIKADISGRPKHIYSIYRKMARKGVPFELVHDVRGVRILVPELKDCYISLGLIHNTWRPIPGEFDDYIAAPKDNFYQSLHTAVVYDDGKTLEVQIRTYEMHQEAEYGVAAHWRYKEGAERDEAFEKRINWLRSVMDWRHDIEDAGDFVEGMKTDVFGDRVFVFTPRGDVIDLQQGATPIDFAYQVHTDIGHRCRGAKVNGKLVSLNQELRTGDQVEILTAKRGGPSLDWLNPNLGMVKTPRATAKIRLWFKKQERAQNLERGQDMMDRELRRLGLTDLNQERLAREFAYRTLEDMHVALGTGELAVTDLVKHLTLPVSQAQEESYPPITSETLRVSDDEGAIKVVGLRGLLTNFAHCCNPAPGDVIVGYVTRGRGVTVHRKDCPNVLRIIDRERLVQVSWGEARVTFPIPVRIRAYDRDGLMRDVSILINDEGVSMRGVRVDVSKNIAIFDLVLEVRDILQLSRVLDRLENVPNVLYARRVRPG